MVRLYHRDDWSDTGLLDECEQWRPFIVEDFRMHYRPRPLTCTSVSFCSYFSAVVSLSSLLVAHRSIHPTHSGSRERHKPFRGLSFHWRRFDKSNRAFPVTSNLYYLSLILCLCLGSQFTLNTETKRIYETLPSAWCHEAITPK